MWICFESAKLFYLQITDIVVANEMFMKVRDEVEEHPGMELHTLLDLGVNLVTSIKEEFKNLVAKQNCTYGGIPLISQMFSEEAERFAFKIPLLPNSCSLDLSAKNKDQCHSLLRKIR